jgi:hypothetical protein
MFALWSWIKSVNNDDCFLGRCEQGLASARNTHCNTVDPLRSLPAVSLHSMRARFAVSEGKKENISTSDTHNVACTCVKKLLCVTRGCEQGVTLLEGTKAKRHGTVPEGRCKQLSQ